MSSQDLTGCETEQWVNHYEDVIFPGFYGFGYPQSPLQLVEYDSLPEVTLSAVTETGKPESSITVPGQWCYTGRKPVIPSSLADTPCTDLGVAGLLEKLNVTLGTTYTLETPSLSSLLEACVAEYYDFGTAHANLRRLWYNDLSRVEDDLHARKTRDQEMRRDVLVNNKIICTDVPPRYVWDLYSNRVVPRWVTWDRHQVPWGISHVWMDDEDRKDLLTPINGYKWPVPIPKDANLDLIRIEMLNLGAEYVWLDILCLRQNGGQRDDLSGEEREHREDLRAEEWKLDVPTIGRVYQMADKVVCYFNGLGRPLCLTPGYFESDRCWFNRVWTLQEVNSTTHTAIGGETGDNEVMEERIRTRISTELLSVQQRIYNQNHLCHYLLSEMKRRVSTNPLDKVVGLAYLLSARYIPAYHEDQDREDAWTSLVNAVSGNYRTYLLFWYPEPGSRKKRWRPSWTQVMTKMLPPPPTCSFVLEVYQQTRRTNGREEDMFKGPCIESGRVRGLAEGQQEGERRQGKLVVKDHRGRKHVFQIVADHQYPIPEGTYTLIGNDLVVMAHDMFQEQHWVVGQRRPESCFKKMSIIKIPNLQDAKRLLDLGIAKETKNVLL